MKIFDICQKGYKISKNNTQINKTFINFGVKMFTTITNRINEGKI
jgi:hypothetical protein